MYKHKDKQHPHLSMWTRGLQCKKDGSLIHLSLASAVMLLGKRQVGLGSQTEEVSRAL